MDRWALKTIHVSYKRSPGGISVCGHCAFSIDFAKPWQKHTGISDRHGRGVDISKVFSNGRHNGHGDWAGGADHDGPEERGSFAGSPAAVFEGGGPEDGGGHGELAEKVEASRLVSGEWFVVRLKNEQMERELLRL